MEFLELPEDRAIRRSIWSRVSLMNCSISSWNWKSVIVFREGKVRHIYFVAETKGTLSSLQLRPIEEAKIACAKKLFEKLHSDCVIYEHVNDFQTLLNRVMT